MAVFDGIMQAVNYGGGIFCEIAQGMFIQVSILILLLILLDLFLRSHSRVSACFRYALWMLVLLKLVLPPSLALPTGIGYWLSQPEPAVVESTPPPVIPLFPLSDNVIENLDEPIMIGGGELVSMEPVERRVALHWQGALFLGWLLVVFGLLVILIRRFLRMRRDMAAVMEAPDDIVRCLQVCCVRLGITQDVRVGLSSDVRGPLVCGFWRPIILLPEKLPEQLSPEALTAVIGHELVHVQRRDTWVNLAQSILQIVYFFHPLVWVANHITGRVRELAVDETVLATFKLKVSQYTGTLIDIAEMAYRKPAKSVCFVGLTESREALERRITHMLQQRSSDRARFGWIGGILILITAALLVPMGQGRLEAEPEPEIKVSASALPEGIADSDPEFARLLVQRVADLDIDHTDREGVEAIFGKPLRYIWYNKHYTVDKLPRRYIMNYPEGFRVFMAEDRIVEIRFEEKSSYVFQGTISIGTPLESVLAVMGAPDKTITGEENEFAENVLFKDISGRKGHCYYHLPDKQVRFWFGDYKVIAIYMTRSDYGGGRKAEPWDETFSNQLAKRVSQLDIDNANRADVEMLFGKPQEYVWGNKTFTEDELKGNYILNYPCDFSVWMKDEKIMEIRFGDESKFAYAPGVTAGASIDDVIAVLGTPVETVEGQENEFKDMVLYRDLAGRRGHCYYHRSDKQIRIWFSDYKVHSIYMTRSDFPAG